MSADRPTQPYQSQLFTIRIWEEEIGGGQTEWRGKVQHVVSGKNRYFRDCEALMQFLVEVLSNYKSGRSTNPEKQDGS